MTTLAISVTTRAKRLLCNRVRNGLKALATVIGIAYLLPAALEAVVDSNSCWLN
jgi:hypothetical protein